MKIIIVPKYIMPFGYSLTLYKLVFVRKDSKNIPYVIAHEATHVKQWTTIGFFKFPFLYLKELIKIGYKNNKYEVQAREEGKKNEAQYKEYMR
jgi:hypothetical protein